MAKGIARRAFDWLLDRGAEKVYQDVIPESPGQKLKSALPALLGTLSMSTVLSWVLDNWIVVAAGSLLFFVVLIYATAVIRVWRMGKSLITSKSAQGVPAIEKKPVQVGMIPVASDWTLRQPLVPSQSDVGVLLKSPAGHFQVNGIGIIRGVWIEFLKQPVEHWECTCVILFHELGVAREASPLQLLLTGQDGQPELATLTATDALPSGSGKVIYTGNARTPEMQLCRQRTMSNLSAAQTIPPPADSYCYVEVHVAPGHRIAHQKTPIRLDYELAKASCHGFFVPIIYKPLKSAVAFWASLQEGLQQALK